MLRKISLRREGHRPDCSINCFSMFPMFTVVLLFSVGWDSCVRVQTDSLVVAISRLSDPVVASEDDVGLLGFSSAVVPLRVFGGAGELTGRGIPFV